MHPPSFATGREALEKADRLVVKIGGENVAFLQENYKNTETRIDQGKKIVLTVSAFRGPRGGFNTTSELQSIAHMVAQGQGMERIDASISRIVAFVTEALTRESEQCTSSQKITRQFQGSFLRNMQRVLSKEKAIFQSSLHEAVHRGVTPRQIGADALLSVPAPQRSLSITGWGEHLAAKAYQEYFTQRGIPAAILPTDTLAFDAYRSDPYHILLEPKAKEAALERMRVHVRSAIADMFWSQGSSLIIAPGYFPLLGTERGYSDTGAAFIAQMVKEACGDVVCLIRKLFPVMQADPRSIAHPHASTVVPYLSFDQAKRAMRKGGWAAGVIHLNALRILKQMKIPTVVGSPQGEENGSLTLVM